MKEHPVTQPKGPKHAHEHAPTVIHDPKADETLLARWFRESLDKGPRFWLPVGGAAVALVVAWIVASSLWSGGSDSSKGWDELMLARSIDERVKVAESADPLPASWAALQAAESRYQEAFSDLPSNREAALPLLTSAMTLFEQAHDKAPDGSAVKRFAAIGVARTLEARGDLDGAIAQYQAVAKAFPGSDEAKRAEELIALLRRPETVAFYQKFSAYKPPEMTLPPRGTGSMSLPGLPPGLDLPGMPGLPAGHPALDGPAIPAPGLGGLPIGPATAAPDVPPAPSPSTTLPADPFASDPPKAP